MRHSNLFTFQRSIFYLQFGVIIFLILLAGKYVVHNALPYYRFDEGTFGMLWNYKWPLIGHITGGLFALIIGPFQFWNAFRNKYTYAHRLLGRIYLIAILIGTISASYLAWTSGLKIHWTWAFALQGLAFAWITTATMAFISVKRRRILQHKEWMIRSYIVTFAFVTFRWLSELQFIQGLGSFVEREPTVIWVSWTIPLLISEIIISWRRK